MARAVLALGLVASGGWAADLSLVPVGPTTVGAEQAVTIEVFLNGIAAPTRLRVYQAQIDIIPQPGAIGTVGLVDPVTLDPNNASIFVDRANPDWVFQGIDPAGVFAGANVSAVQIGGLLFNPSDSVSVTTPKYCGTYIVQSTPGAEGDFLVRFRLSDPGNPAATPTLISDQNGALIPFTTSDLTITVTPQVTNDLCVDRLAAFSGATPFNTFGATTDGPTPPLSCDDGNGLGFGQDVWFEHFATCTGLLTVSDCGAADFNTRLSVFGSGGALCTCPTDNTSLLACADDTAGCAGGTSELSVPVVAGSCLTIRVGGLDAAAGSGTLNITCTPDLCADAVRIMPGGNAAGSTRNTTVNDGIGPDCGGGPVDSPGAWYVVTGTGNQMTASVRGTASFDTRLTVYRGGCAALTCVGDANIAGNGGERVSWCSTAGVEYLMLVHGVGGAAGTFTLDVASVSCDDANQCTDDTCSAGVCMSALNFDPLTQCCAPSTRTLTPIDDGNPCTDDVCNATTGVVAHPPKANGPIAGCDDGNPCTTDACLSGTCVSTDINGRPCAVDADCPGDATCVNNACECVAVTYELVASPGSLPSPGCYDVGDTFTVRVELGPRGVPNISPQPIVGAQFFLDYDPTTMAVLSIDPGSTIDPASLFSVELGEVVDSGTGTIDYLAGVSFGAQGVRDPATVAVITFRMTAECNAFVAFRLSGPNGAVNRVTTSGGAKLDPILIDPAPYLVDRTAPVLTSCPANVVVGSDAGRFTATATWSPPSATDTCEVGSVPVVCTPASGSVFDPGTTPVTCTATDSCGRKTSCAFSVTVIPSRLVADVELSPAISAGPILRCITFDLWDCNSPSGAQHATVEKTFQFTNGRATGAAVSIPGGAWTCLTARDRLHTLRATATDLATADGVNYTASFLGSRSAGGHWLVGGNLNDDGFIDILDFGVFFPRFLTQAASSTACGTTVSDANVNGDQVVDLLDLVFVSGNSLTASEPGCCGVGIAAAADGPTISISIRELRKRGLGYMAVADLNRDGVLDSGDVRALLSGDIPPVGGGRPRRGETPVKVERRRGPRAQQ